MSRFPVREQVERGKEVFATVLQETPVGVPNGNARSRSFELSEVHAPFTHVAVGGTLDPSGYHGRRQPTIVAPFIGLFLQMGENNVAGMRVNIEFRDLLLRRSNVTDDHRLTSSVLRRLVPGYYTLRGYSNLAHTDMLIAEGNFRTERENMPQGRLTAEILSIGLDTLTSLGGKALVAALEVTEPEAYSPQEQYESSAAI